MSKETIEGIHNAIQAHLDDIKDDPEQLVDFVVARASLTSSGSWGIGYITSFMVSPHGSVGLLNQAVDILQSDMAGRS